MTLHARSDVMSVTVPVGSGGCGQTHSRPVTNGKPAKNWTLDCVPCESYLKQDIINSNYRKRRIGNGAKEDLKERWPGLWGHSETAIPETPSEEEQREFGEAEAAKNAAKLQLENATTTAESLKLMAEAVAGNSALMAQILAAAARNPAPPAEVMPSVTPVHDGFNSRACEDCNADIIRAGGQKGALPHRCPACKARRRAEQNAAYEAKRRQVA
jgi:hypothetical protein